jgi:O-acetylhomoserine/O-acetylserine sulfhydrylase-like pyridoxal-dependent enzyme
MSYSKGIEHYIAKAKEIEIEERKRIERIKRLKFATIAVNGVYTVEEAISKNQGSVIEPLYLSTAQAFRDADEMEAALAYLIPAWVYSRIANPTVYYLESVLALLEGYEFEGETSCVCTSSGMAAVMSAVEPFLVKTQKGSSEKMNFVSMAQIYGGTFQQFFVRKMEERGIEVRWVLHPEKVEEWEEKVDSSTRFLFGEMPSNPGLKLFDIKRVAEIAHKNGIPLIVDSTIATPALLRPLLYGADIVIHSITKSMSLGGLCIAGAVISRKDIVTNIGPPEMRKDFATYLKLLPNRDLGPCLSPMNALLVLNELRTLALKMERLSESAIKIAQFLEAHSKIESVDYLGLPSHPLHKLAKQYMMLVDSNGKNLYGHLLSFKVKGNHESARQVLDNFRLIWRATDLGRIKTIASIPTISTHQQQGEEAREMAGISPQMIRLSVGAEEPGDIIADLDQALSSI